LLGDATCYWYGKMDDDDYVFLLYVPYVLDEALAQLVQ
jgi:hypothetical protein